MFAVEVITPPAAEPVTVAELRSWLRLADDDDADDLEDMLAAAVEQFEHDAGRPVLATVYRQYLSRWPAAPIVLGRGGVTAVAGVYRYLADGTTTAAVTGWAADLRTPPVRVTLAEQPALVETAAGVPVSPVGFVEFTAGWANAAAVPKQARVAIRAMAGHWYENREAYREGKVEEVPDGWWRVVRRFKLGVSGDWGQ